MLAQFSSSLDHKEFFCVTVMSDGEAKDLSNRENRAAETHSDDEVRHELKRSIGY